MKIEELKKIIHEETKGRLSEEQIDEIIKHSGLKKQIENRKITNQLNRIIKGFELDEVEVVVTSNPYEYGATNVAKTESENDYSLKETITGVIGDTKGGAYEEPYQGDLIDESADFSLNEVQASVKNGEEYDDGVWDYPVTINVYLPEQKYDVETFKELKERDKMQHEEILAKAEDASLKGIKEEMDKIKEAREVTREEGKEEK